MSQSDIRCDYCDEKLKTRIAELELQLSKAQADDALCRKLSKERTDRLKGQLAEAQQRTDKIIDAIDRTFRSKVGVDGYLLVGVDAYNKLADLINEDGSAK